MVSLIHDAQEIAILNGKEILNLELLNEAYQQRLSLLHGFISAGHKNQTGKVKKRSASVVKKDVSGEVSNNFCIAGLVAKAKEENVDIVELLKAHITVVEVAL